MIRIPAMFAGAALLPGVALAQTVSLSGPADADSRITEIGAFSAFAQIDFGDGMPGDADGAYSIIDDSLFGTGVDVFPNETAFSVGSVSYDDGILNGSGPETLPVTAIDLSSFVGNSGSGADISNLDLLFTPGNIISFGGLDASDTISFEDGVPTSIDLEIDFFLTLFFDFSGTPTTYEGSFSISGDQFLLSMNSEETNIVSPFAPGGIIPSSTVIFDVRGRVSAVPAPGAMALFGCGAFAAARRRRSIR